MNKIVTGANATSSYCRGKLERYFALGAKRADLVPAIILLRDLLSSGSFSFERAGPAFPKRYISKSGFGLPRAKLGVWASCR